MASSEIKLVALLEERKNGYPVQKYSGYEPSAGEEFMNPRMKEYFFSRITSMINELEEDIKSHLNSRLREKSSASDYMDKASISLNQDLNLFRYNSQCELLRRARLALQRLKLDTYGYCAITGLPINVRRLVANPVADMNLETTNS